MTLLELRRAYHQYLFQDVIRVGRDKLGNLYPNFADSANRGSVTISSKLVSLLELTANEGPIAGQTKGGRFEEITRNFLAESLSLVAHLRPGRWHYATYATISQFEQYHHLAEIQRIIQSNDELAAALGADYIIKPDIIVGRAPFTEPEINRQMLISDGEDIATLTPMRAQNQIEPRWFLHASISCKWTLRSDRAQNARAEALNLLRNRKGRAPHISVVTAEPLPTRINSIALGTGDLDCVYHFALYELIKAVESVGSEDQREALYTLIEGKRLRDISDLPLDLLG